MRGSDDGETGGDVQQAASLQLGLPSPAGVEPHDAAARTEVELAVLGPERTDGHVELTLAAIRIDPPDGSG